MSLYKRNISNLKDGQYSDTKLLDLLKTRIWNSSDYPFEEINQELKHTPTMLSEEEKRLLNWLAKYYYSGQGSIIDLGAFLGGSTIQLCNGLVNNINNIATNKKLVHSYDRFEFSEVHKQKWLYNNGHSSFDGTDVLPIVQLFLKDYSHILELHKGDFLDVKWQIDSLVEILFIDIAKTWDLSDHIIRTFFPLLIPGKSLIVQQDMLYVNCPWICAVMFRLKDYFKLICATEKHSVLFLNTQKIDSDAITWAMSDNFHHRDILNSIDYFIDQFTYFPHKEVLQSLKNRCIQVPGAKNSWDLN